MSATPFHRIACRNLARAARLILFAICGPLAVIPTLRAQPVPVTYRTPNRWLLIVETSRATRQRSESVAQSAGNLALSGLNGQARPGDTLGLWTFNNSLHRGEFPLQTWTATNANVIAENIAGFLGRQAFEGRPGRSVVFPAMNEVISNSDFITVILITSGNETVAGTPFDRVINETHGQWRNQQEKARQPFLTLLRAQRGIVTDFEVARPPALLEFPPLPPELLITNPIVRIPAPPKPIEVPPVPIAPNLIVHGKKPAPAAEIHTNVLAATATSPTNVAPELQARANPPPPLPLQPTNAISTTTTQAALGETPLAATPPAAPPQAKEIRPATSPSNSRLFWILGPLVAFAAAAAAWALLRRSQSQPRVSLITQSLERQKK